jgi:hypothetical protein
MHDCCECCVMKHAIGHADPCPRHQRNAPKIQAARPTDLPKATS